jgi:hypothetical protein
MDTAQRIELYEAALVNLGTQRTCALRLGDVDRIEQIDAEMAQLVADLEVLRAS